MKCNSENFPYMVTYMLCMESCRNIIVSQSRRESPKKDQNVMHPGSQSVTQVLSLLCCCFRYIVHCKEKLVLNNMPPFTKNCCYTYLKRKEEEKKVLETKK